MRRWVSPDGRFAMAFAAGVVDAVDRYIDDAHPNETGGVLVGHYDDSFGLAKITSIGGPPPDSRAGRTWFRRGTKDLAMWFAALWAKPERRYYLGEWHYHPSHRIEPSLIDLRQMESIAASPNYHCPEPLMIIFGEGRTPRPLRAFVHPHGKGTELLEGPTTSGDRQT